MTDRLVTVWACPRCGDPEDGTGLHTADQCIAKLKADVARWKECYAVVCRQLEYRNTELVQRLQELADARQAGWDINDAHKTQNWRRIDALMEANPWLKE